jgi:hypothetical protein
MSDNVTDVSVEGNGLREERRSLQLRRNQAKTPTRWSHAGELVPERTGLHVYSLQFLLTRGPYWRRCIRSKRR